MLYKIIIALFLFVGTANAQYWEVTLSFGHDDPVRTKHYNVYCKNTIQTWEQGFKWQVENTLSTTDPDDEIEFTTPKVLPEKVFYCCAATAVDFYGYESDLPKTGPYIYDKTDQWDCLWIKTESMSFKE
jgi:hypothetical protein